jgi:hypothetical protein
MAEPQLVSVDSLTRDLSNGQPASEVLDRLRGHFKAGHGVQNAVYAVRRRLLEAGHAHPNLDEFALTHEEISANKRRSEQAVLARNAAPLVVTRGAALVDTIHAMLLAATTETTYANLSIPLLIASGRRMAEIMNGSSVFKPTSNAHICVFTGQLKKKSEAVQPYCIPLLVPFTVFSHGLTVLQKKQSASRARAITTNAQCAARYQKTLQEGLDAMTEKNTVPLPPCHLHSLRAIYAALVYELFASSHQFCYTAMRILGHSHLQESLPYSYVRVLGVDGVRGVFGPLQFLQ